ncbi:hypothetical protein CLU79DRAFT_757215 [Phycomyces nitens]|nr:hypothetical protein CLU79DRAFT_757215 [Phycomyces nitens]
MTTTRGLGGESRQRAFHVRKPLKEFIHKPKQHLNSTLSLPLPSLPAHDQTKEEYVYDVLYECQRGSWMVGFSSKTLLQFDPDPWCDKDMRYTPMDIKTYQLPDPTWEWVHKQWMVDMTEDVDEAGWQYALKFHGASWHGNYKHFRSFVRKRRWIRLRHHSLQDLTTNNNIPDQQESHHKDQTLFESLQECRLDRERLCYIKRELNSDSGKLGQDLMAKAKDFMDLFDFDVSRRNYVEVLLHHLRSHGIPIDSKALQPALEGINYYSDLQAIQSQIKTTQ